MKSFYFGIFCCFIFSCNACLPTQTAVEPVTVCGPEICSPPGFGATPLTIDPPIGSATADASCVYHHSLLCPPSVPNYISLSDSTATNVENPANVPNTVFIQCSADDPNTVYVKTDGTSFIVFSIFCPP